MKITADTNVLVRALVQDEPVQVFSCWLQVAISPMA
jgi:predicted nucleic-acid-binding protein